MKKISNILFGIIVALAAVFLLYQKGYILTEYESVSPQEAAQMIKIQEGNVTILDVRTPQEYQRDGHIVNSVLVPVRELASKLDALEKFKNTKIIVYCRSGNRSVSASRLLSEKGFHVYNLKGGINQWKKEHLPVEIIRIGR